MVFVIFFPSKFFKAISAFSFLLIKKIVNLSNIKTSVSALLPGSPVGVPYFYFFSMNSPAYFPFLTNFLGVVFNKPSCDNSITLHAMPTNCVSWFNMIVFARISCKIFR